MKSIQRFPKILHPVVLAGVVLAGTFGTALIAAAQDLPDLQTPKSPLVLKDEGSFFVGGEVKAVEAGDLGAARPPGHITVNQMYVEYMIPQGATKVPVVMIHGGTLSGKTYETTPDGRMGWEQYFVRQGHPVYNAEQVSRARSGFDSTVFNRVRDGRLPGSALPNIIQTSAEFAWPAFRFGPTLGVPWPDTRFPVEAMDEFGKQGIPDLNAMLPSPNPIYKALSDLAIKLNGAVVMGHSESGRFPLEAALVSTTGIKGLIDIESTGCNATVYTDQQIAKLATVPILVLFGDHIDTVLEGFPNFWRNAFDNCKAFVNRVNAAGGNAQFLWPPDLGIFGNSHMLMNDKNSDQIADLILKWIDEKVGKKKIAKK